MGSVSPLPPPGPLRTLAYATLVNTVGAGLWLAGGALYLTRDGGLSATSVGAGLTVAGLVGLTATIGPLWTLLLVGYVVASALAIALADSTALVVVWFLLSLPALGALLAWTWIRLTYLAVPALMLEHVGVFASLGRSFGLTRRQFWRTFGIALLTSIITAVAAQILTVPFSIAGSVATIGFSESTAGLVVYLIASALGTVASTAFVAPFTAAVTTVQYLDQRIRKEAYDVELMARAGVTPG